MSIYQDIILEYYRNPRNFGHLKSATNQTSLKNPLCGDTIEMEIVEKDGVVQEIAYTGSGCAISQASASMLTDFVKGKTKDEIKKIDKEVITDMLGIELSPNRLKCALLSLEALHILVQDK